MRVLPSFSTYIATLSVNYKAKKEVDNYDYYI